MYVDEDGNFRTLDSIKSEWLWGVKLFGWSIEFDSYLLRFFRKLD